MTEHKFAIHFAIAYVSDRTMGSDSKACGRRLSVGVWRLERLLIVRHSHISSVYSVSSELFPGLDLLDKWTEGGCGWMRGVKGVWSKAHKEKNEQRSGLFFSMIHQLTLDKQLYLWRRRCDRVYRKGSCVFVNVSEGQRASLRDGHLSDKLDT